MCSAARRRCACVALRRQTPYPAGYGAPGYPGRTCRRRGNSQGPACQPSAVQPGGRLGRPAAAAAAVQADIFRGMSLPGDRAESAVSTLLRISEAEGQVAGRSPTAVTSLQPGASPWVSRHGRHPALTHPAIGAAGFPAGFCPPPASHKNSASSACRGEELPVIDLPAPWPVAPHGPPVLQLSRTGRRRTTARCRAGEVPVRPSTGS
jgi:hypothetical protein